VVAVILCRVSLGRGAGALGWGRVFGGVFLHCLWGSR
jgi:hypothetical protein